MCVCVCVCHHSHHHAELWGDLISLGAVLISPIQLTPRLGDERFRGHNGEGEERNHAQQFRAFLNLWFGKPMVCVRVACRENDGNHENDEIDEDNSDSYKQGVECWIRGNHGNHENYENHGNPGRKPRVPQTTGLEIPDNLSKDKAGAKFLFAHLFYKLIPVRCGIECILPPSAHLRSTHAAMICT